MIQVIIGGLLATFGGMMGIWFQAKNARRIKMDEIIAEKKVQANNEAYIRIKTIEGMLLRSSLSEVKRKIDGYDEWFFNTRLFLPGRFPDKWLTLKFSIFKVVQLEQTIKEKEVIESDDIKKKLEDVNILVKEAIREIYREMNLSKEKVERLPSERYTDADED